MIRQHRQLFLVVVSATAFGLAEAWSAEPGPIGGPPAAPNAAVIYWQAFASLPTLTDEEKTKYDAVTKTMSEPLPDDVATLLERFASPLNDLRRASSVPTCDWNVDYSAGPEILLPHLAKARELSRAGILRARWRFAHDESDEALADILAVLKMGRDCGESPLIISLLVSIAIQTNAADALAANLPTLDEKQLDTLLVRIKALPKPASLPNCIRTEEAVFCGWLESHVDAASAKAEDPRKGGQSFVDALTAIGFLNPQAMDKNAATKLNGLTADDVRESLRLLRADYQKLIAIAELPPAERKKQWADADARLTERKTMKNKNDHLYLQSTALLPSLSRVSEREESFENRSQLLDLAIQIQRHGRDSVKTLGTVEYKKNDGGFELSLPNVENGKTEVLKVGGAK